MGGGEVITIFSFVGIIQDVFDYDYAPSSEVIGTNRLYMNISQEGKDDIDDLREAGLISGLKVRMYITAAPKTARA